LRGANERLTDALRQGLGVSEFRKRGDGSMGSGMSALALTRRLIPAAASARFRSVAQAPASLPGGPARVDE
jgi:hypothetical protein